MENKPLGEPNIMVLGQEVVIDRRDEGRLCCMFCQGDYVHRVRHKIQNHIEVNYMFCRGGFCELCL